MNHRRNTKSLAESWPFILAMLAVGVALNVAKYHGLLAP